MHDDANPGVGQVSHTRLPQRLQHFRMEIVVVFKYSIHQGVDMVGEPLLVMWAIAMEHLAISGRKASWDFKAHSTAIFLVL